MRKRARKTSRVRDRDTMRPEYDFSRAVRGLTAARYAEGTNIAVIAPDVVDLFPDSESVNRALRSLAVKIRRGRMHASKRKTA